MHVGKVNATATLIATGASEAPRSGKAACRLDAGSVANQRNGDGADGAADAAADARCDPMGPWRRGCGRSRCSAVPVGWQDSRAVRDSRGQCGEKGPSLARSSRYAFPKGDCWAFRIHGAHILPNPARFGCMAAICCQGGVLFPSGAPSGMHEAKKLPRTAAWERTTAKSCHGLPPGNASRRNIAAASHSRTHFAKILPWTNAWIRLAANNDRSPAKQRQRQDPGNAPTKTKEGERFARLLSLFSFTARVARTFEVTSRPP